MTEGTLLRGQVTRENVLSHLNLILISHGRASTKMSHGLMTPQSSKFGGGINSLNFVQRKPLYNTSADG